MLQTLFWPIMLVFLVIQSLQIAVHVILLAIINVILVVQDILLLDHHAHKLFRNLQLQIVWLLAKQIAQHVLFAILDLYLIPRLIHALYVTRPYLIAQLVIKMVITYVWLVLLDIVWLTINVYQVMHNKYKFQTVLNIAHLHQALVINVVVTIF